MTAVDLDMNLCERRWMHNEFDEQSGSTVSSSILLARQDPVLVSASLKVVLGS